VLETIDRWIGKTAYGFNVMAALCVVTMMLLTCADVFLRLFRLPITGTYELVGFFGALFVSFSLAHTSLMKGHIAVDFFVQRLAPGVRDILMFVNDLIGAILFALISWQFTAYARSLKAAGEVSMTLQIPIYPIAWGLGFGCGLLFIVLFFRALNAVLCIVEKHGYINFQKGS
jgi:TRAP-type C4-dicarboxylate transport system permease small subunit